MKLQFKHQQFQTDAAEAVCDVFAGQPYMTSQYRIDPGRDAEALDFEYTGWRNEPIVPELTAETILSNLRRVQERNQISPSDLLEGRYNLTVEMETGTGKTYTYIKTMYELNKRYGWSKFIVVVPSIAIREGVYKTFQTTEDHFMEEYGRKIRYFIYNSSRLTEIDHFASDAAITAMIINAQAFNARGKDARRIRMALDEFQSRRPIDVIAQTNPILIIDEPQSVEGQKTKEGLREFHPLFTLRYSATPRERYNLVYRLDAMDAYNKRLVKKISVVGISQNRSTGTEGYLYLDRLNLSEDKNPTATLEFEQAGKAGVRRVTRTVSRNYNLYPNSNHLDQYRDGFVVQDIDGRTNAVTFLNGLVLHAGDVVGLHDEAQLRRIQIRETIRAHLERERQLFPKGIKVLSLFFIDEVKNYRDYDDAGQPRKGVFAEMFEEEYRDCVAHMQQELGEDPRYMTYLDGIRPEETHAGYFSIDKKKRFTDSKIANRKEQTSDDQDAYDLIMKDKERLLDFRTPVRFIFSHSALREGWDNPNVFQICTLKQSSSEVRKHQEVGRGLRLCVNQQGERMDESVLGGDVQQVNRLTVIASESYANYADALQKEMSEMISDRPLTVTADLFRGRMLTTADGRAAQVDDVLASNIYFDLRSNNYIDSKGHFTDKYREDRKNNAVQLSEEVAPYSQSVLNLLDAVYDGKALAPEDGRGGNVELRLNRENFAKKEFRTLWAHINAKSAYTVSFDPQELIRKSITVLDEKLHVSRIYFQIESGTMDHIASKDQLRKGMAFTQEQSDVYGGRELVEANARVKYDLIGRLVDATGLTRKDTAAILTGIRKNTFEQFKYNPEEFIAKAGTLINEQKADVVIEHITYHMLDDRYDTDIFADASLRGRLGMNAMRTKKNLYDHLIYDSDKERDFAAKLDLDNKVVVYVKLPKSFFISTPMGHYSPDWAIAFKEGTVKHIYFVAETKGSLSSFQLRPMEADKIKCARAHFKAISSRDVVYDVVTSYDELLTEVIR